MKISAFFLAAMLLSFSDVHASPDLAATQKSAEQGDAVAQLILGLMYESGRGVPQHDRQAAAWFRKAAEQGHADAQVKLGRMYEEARGVPQDYSQAMAWYRKAAEQGQDVAQFLLGTM